MSKQQSKIARAANVVSPQSAEETIGARAYQLFEQHGYEHGHDLDDWLQAEAELVGKKPERASEDGGGILRRVAAA